MNAAPQPARLGAKGTYAKRTWRNTKVRIAATSDCGSRPVYLVVQREVTSLCPGAFLRIRYCSELAILISPDNVERFRIRRPLCIRSREESSQASVYIRSSGTASCGCLCRLHHFEMSKNSQQSGVEVRG